MPFTFNGCGTSFYGKRYPAQDGSYVTTKWVTGLWVPLLPLGSYRVRPTGKGTNAVVYHSLNFQTVRVPLCWPQVRNVYIFAAPILALIIYFNWADIQKWWKHDVKTNSARLVLKAESTSSQADVQLTDKAMIVACGRVLKLDRAAFAKFDLVHRLPQLVDNIGFTGQELTAFSSSDELRDKAFEGYSLGFLTWEKPADDVRATLDQELISHLNSIDLRKLSTAERTQLDSYFARLKRLMLRALDLGRQDARISPCL
jgi:hypothetical protein